MLEQCPVISRLFSLDSEPAFFNYIRQVVAEKEYLLTEILPEWKHKFYRVKKPNTSQSCTPQESRIDNEICEWWDNLHEEIEKWQDEAEDIEIPDFEETVAEYKFFQMKELRKTRFKQERRSRQTTIDLDGTVPKKLGKIDSGFGL